jgi:hypothetical protein
MRVLVSAVGTRGDVHPAVAFALELRRLGHDVRLCVSPSFVEWVSGLGFAEATPVGVEMRYHPPATGTAAVPTQEESRRISDLSDQRSVRRSAPRQRGATSSSGPEGSSKKLSGPQSRSVPFSRSARRGRWRGRCSPTAGGGSRGAPNPIVRAHGVSSWKSPALPRPLRHCACTGQLFQRERRFLFDRDVASRLLVLE